jgi:hypothetical protein
VLQAAKRYANMDRPMVDAAVAALEGLLPELAPNLDKMRARDWCACVAFAGTGYFILKGTLIMMACMCGVFRQPLV